MADIVQDYTKKLCPPYVWMPPCIHNTKKACFVRLRGCPYAPYIWDAPICLDASLYVGMPPYVWMAPCIFGCPHMPPSMFGCPCMFRCPLYLDAPVCFDTPYVYMPPICLDDVWMPPVHAQHKESMLCQAKGVSICPNTFGCHLYINNTKKTCFVRLRGCPYAPIHFNFPYVWIPPCIFGCLLYVEMPPYVWMDPLYVWMPPYVWMALVCLDAPICLETPICLDAHLYVWTPPMFAFSHLFGCPLYV